MHGGILAPGGSGKPATDSLSRAPTTAENQRRRLIASAAWGEVYCASAGFWPFALLHTRMRDPEGLSRTATG